MLSKAVFSDANGFTRKPPYSLRMILDLCVISVNPISCPKLLSVLSTPSDSSPYWSYFSSFTLYLNLPGPSVLSSFVSAYLSLRPFSLVVWFGWGESRSLWPSAQKTIHENVLLFHNALLHKHVRQGLMWNISSSSAVSPRKCSL